MSQKRDFSKAVFSLLKKQKKNNPYCCWISRNLHRCFIYLFLSRVHSWAGCSEMYKEPRWKWEEDLLTCSSVMEIVGKFFILSLSAGGGPVFSNWFNNYKWKTDRLTMTSCDQIRMTTRPIKSKETSLHISICLITSASLGSCKRAFFDSRHKKKKNFNLDLLLFFRLHSHCHCYF